MYRNFAVISCAFGLLGILAGCLGMSVSFEPTNPNLSPEETSTLQRTIPAPLGSEKVISAGADNIKTTPSQQEKPSAENSPDVLAYQISSANKSKVSGSLRMSNQTNQPVRLALLAHKSTDKKSSNNKTQYNVPAHWDFAPQEGSQKGLILSLPEGNLKLETGDILVAFAQDGSRSYWGPYVVGETPSPQWNSQAKEWQLELTP
ncbi:hypothetical protein Anacy_3344 [Anabaena cylindrica PCC 7122]|uniref:Lipoprotein n=2 Tax=Nostocaceae TaxID=1162 RepID=K9ZHP0_ANACC|nr:hypothetical protein Anacy_3344 [Anabaena cylindrica PCC 7122]BAY04241.1 hypothetical protein NIES19_35040 [Anabaena cylindrica PCC 7122]